MHARHALEFRLLGPVSVTTGSTVLPLGGHRQRALLALLLLQPGHAVSADRLVEELWCGAPPGGAAATLRTYASRLRHALGPDSLSAEAGGYRLDVERCQVDVCRFEELHTEGSAALAAAQAGRAAERLRAALELWQGPALADVADGGALGAEASRLEALRMVCLEERIAADLTLGRHEGVVTELSDLVHRWPLRERLWQHFALALYRCGRQAEALAALREARDRLRDDLGLDLGDELRALHDQILCHHVTPAARVDPARHNLPAPATSFVGRDAELRELAGLIREHRMVTVTGLGGAGKTRLALEAARRQLGCWSDGVWLVELAGIADADLVPGALAGVLGVAEGAGRTSLEAVHQQLGEQEALLVLDNCEHLLDASAQLAGSLLRGCPGVQLLATSRRRLTVPGEVEFALEPLPAPTADTADAELRDLPAVRLFVERAAAVCRNGAATDESSMHVVAQICRDLDGLPLAIELAAARVKTLSLPEIAVRLGDRFRFLRTPQRAAEPRHRTLRTTMDWSYDLLEAPARELLARLSVFADGATLDAVGEVCLGGDRDLAETLLERLVDASLVRAETGTPTRYLLLETVRQYASGHLARGPDAEALRRAHARYYAVLAESANLSIEALGHGPQQQHVVLRDQHNLRAAIDWAVEADVALAARLVLALENFWVSQAVDEGRRRLGAVLGKAAPLAPLVRARLERDHAGLADVMQEFDEAREGYTRSRTLYSAAGDDGGVAYLDFRLGIVAFCTGDEAGARALWESSLEVFRRRGDEIGELQALGNLGELELGFGDADRGAAMLEASIDMAENAGWWWFAVGNLGVLAEAAVAAGRMEEAERDGRRLLLLARRMADPQQTTFALAVLARAAAARGEDRRALSLWSCVSATSDREGRFGRFDRAAYAATMPPGSVGTPLSLQDAVALALSGRPRAD